MNNQQSTMRETLNLLNSVAQGRRILTEGRVGQIADDLESLSDAEFQKEYGKTKAEMRKSFSGGEKKSIKEGRVGQISDDLENLSDAEFEKEYGKTKAEMRKSFSDKESVKEDADHLDPNLSKAYNMGHEAYRAFKNDPERAQAAQDEFDSMEIVKKNPHYAKMWVTGYRDGERFDKQESLKENMGHSVEDMAEDALNAAVKSIQDSLGITTGDLAGRFFSGEQGEMILKILADYIEQEMSEHGDDTDF